MILCSREMATVMMRPITKSASGMEEIVAAQMCYWTTALNVVVWIQTLEVTKISKVDLRFMINLFTIHI